MTINLKGHLKTVVKTVTYRVMNGCYGFVVAYLVTGKLAVAAAVVGAEAAYKVFAYYGHERLWEMAWVAKIFGGGTGHA